MEISNISSSVTKSLTATLDSQNVEAQAQNLLTQMSLEEKVAQMSGSATRIPGLITMLYKYNYKPYPAGPNPRLGIAAMQFTDGPRGVVLYHSTCFPVAIGRGASWDVALEERVGDAIGVEARSQGANLFAGVCINVLRHPAWGRAQETFGEDPYHLGEMGAALVRGSQRHVMACIKHFAANSIENTRFKVNVKVSERTLREIYLPHFKRCIDEGAAAVMSAYNRVNGPRCGQHNHLLRDILKQEWGFKGFVMSDFVFGISDGKKAVLGGLDMEMPFTQHFGKKLVELVRLGEIPEAMIDEAALRILRQKLRFASIGEPERYIRHHVAGQKHRELAREAAQKTIVLLKNASLAPDEKKLLPLQTKKLRRIAVIGHLARAKNVGDLGSSRVRNTYTVTAWQGISEAAGSQVEVVYHDGKKPLEAAEVARSADVAIVVAGYTTRHEGENIGFRGGDRKFLTLPVNDENLINQVAAANPATVVVMIGGSAIITEAWRENVPAILMAWYPGMEGGRALADVLFGKVSPSAKLPCVFPKIEAQLPFFDSQATEIEYDYYHGYRLMDKKQYEPAFAFGFGLSYTNYTYQKLKLENGASDTNNLLRASVEITNTGEVAREEIAQLYISYPPGIVDRPIKELKGFQKIKLEPGETRRVSFEVPLRQMAYYDEENGKWKIEAGKYKVLVGSSSRSEDLISQNFILEA